MSFVPIAVLIKPDSLSQAVQDAQAAGLSSHSGTFRDNFGRIYPQFAECTNAGGQVQNRCRIHFVVVQLPAPAKDRKGYEGDDFNSDVFEQVVLGDIEPDQRGACQARMHQRNYFILQQAPLTQGSGGEMGEKGRGDHALCVVRWKWCIASPVYTS